ncbi:MAG: acyl-CoA dehydrogenase family protein, partial [Chloroflexota bacterium]
MDFTLTRQQEMLRDTVREFAETELAPRALELDRERKFPWDIVKKAGELGLVGVMTPKAYGGTEMGHLARMIIIEEVSRIYPSLGFFFQTAHLAQWSIQAHGSDEQKQKYLPRMCKGDMIMGDAITEPAGGSDLAAHQTVAERQGDEYVLNGRKCWVTYPEIADSMLVLAKTGDRFSEFIVETGTPGYEVTRRENMTGLQTIPVNEMALTNCHVPASNLVGEEGKGTGVGLAAVSIMGRTGVAGVGLGIAQGCFEAAVNFAKERKLYGQPIANLQGIQYALVDMHVDIESA